MTTIYTFHTVTICYQDLSIFQHRTKLVCFLVLFNLLGGNTVFTTGKNSATKSRPVRNADLYSKSFLKWHHF